MPPKIHEKDGVLAIYDSNHPDAMIDPGNNVQYTYFHSGLDYLERFFTHATTISLPLRSSYIFTGNYGRATHSLPDHNFGAIPHGVIVKDNYALSPGQAVHVSGAASRYLTLMLTETQMWLSEYWHLPNSYVPAEAIDIEIHLFKPIEGNGSNYLVREDPQNADFEYDRGRITPDKTFLRKDQFNPEFYIRHGKTLDLKNGGIRHVTPGGGVIDLGGYNGDFNIDNDYGVRVNG